MKRIVLVTGGRGYKDQGMVFTALDYIHEEQPITLLIEGGADGADKLARAWADRHDVHRATINAIWYPYLSSGLDRSAGPKRNSIMATINIDIGVAFPGNDGTADMVKKLRADGIEVREFGFTLKTGADHG